jgi:plastocyanin
VFNAASKLYFILGGLAVVVGIAYVIGPGDRVGFTDLAFAGTAAIVLGVAVFVFVPSEPLTAEVAEAAEPRPADATDIPRPSPWPVFGALALGLMAAGAATEGSLILIGVIVALVAVFAWFGQVWREHPSWTQDMVDRLNDRFVVPIGLPGTIFLLTGIGVVSLSRLFLAVPVDAAPLIGIVLAFGLLGVFWFLANREVGRPAMTTLATVGVGLVLASGVAGALRGEREFHHKGGEGEFVIAADNLEFDKSELDFPAASEITLKFENHEPVPHNVSIYQSKGGEVIFEGPVLQSEGEADYEFTTPEAGSYYFQCDVHPDQMNGTVNVAEEASEEVEKGENVTTTSVPGDDQRGPDETKEQGGGGG